MKKFLRVLWGLVKMVFYPIVSFQWAKYARIETAWSYYWKFLATGIAGMIGCALCVWMWNVPMPQRFLLALMAVTFYCGGRRALYRMIDAVLMRRVAHAFGNMVN